MTSSPPKQTKAWHHPITSAWTLIGLVVTVWGVLSLFGELGAITLSEYFERIVGSFRSLFRPLADFLTFNLRLDPWQKDMIWVYFFFTDKILQSISGYFFSLEGKKGTVSVKDKMIEDFQTLFGKSKLATVLGVVSTKAAYFALSVWLVYLDDLPSIHEVSPENIVSRFFVALYVVPLIFLALITTAQITIGTVEVIVHMTHSAVAFLCRIATRIRLREDDSPTLAEKLQRRWEIYRPVPATCISIYIVNIAFTMLFYLLLGLNYQIRK